MQSEDEETSVFNVFAAVDKQTEREFSVVTHHIHWFVLSKIKRRECINAMIITTHMHGGTNLLL